MLGRGGAAGSRKGLDGVVRGEYGCKNESRVTIATVPVFKADVKRSKQ